MSRVPRSGPVFFAALAGGAALLAGCHRWYKPPKVSQFVVGSRGGVATLADGRAFVWGAHHAASFSGEPRVPARAAELDGATKLASSATEACGVVAGTIRCVGAEPGGRRAEDDDVPDAGGAVDELALGEGFRCARAGASLRCFGAAAAWPSLVPAQVRAVDAAGTRLCVLAGAPPVLACVHAGRPEPVPAQPEGLGAFRGLSVSAGYACVVDEGGKVACRAAEGPLKPVPELAGTASLALGAKHGVARRLDGRAVVWGEGPASEIAGQLSAFHVVPGLFGVVSVTAAQDVSCVTLADGTVRCWGLAPPGALPVRVPGRLAVPTEVDWSRADLSTTVPAR